jgi:ABC-type bacteriocin/lantibiotic exporter with double-glycine peptidase domain
VSLVSKLVGVGIMWLGALQVVDNKLSVGELVAFNMLAGQVAAHPAAGAIVERLPAGRHLHEPAG